MNERYDIKNIPLPHLDLEIKEAPGLAHTVLIWDPREYEDMTFEETYAIANNLTAKFVWAKELLLHNLTAKEGENVYEHPEFLVNNFIPPNIKYVPKTEKDVSVEQASVMKEYLGLLLLENLRFGKIEPDTPAGQIAFEQVPIYIDRNEDLRRLEGVIPLPLMEEIVYGYLFEHFTQEEMVAKYKTGLYQSIIRPYLGNISYYKQKGEVLTFEDVLRVIPEKILQDPNSLARNIARQYFTSEALRYFLPGEEAGFERFFEEIANEEIREREAGETGIKKELLLEIYQEFEEASSIVIPPEFKDSVAWVEGWVDKNLPFPHFRQKYFVYLFQKSRRFLLNGDTGSTKTACAYLATSFLEKSDIEQNVLSSQRVIILGPAKARNTWPNEAKKIFKEGKIPKIFPVRKLTDITSPEFKTAQYVYISDEILSYHGGNVQKRKELIKQIVSERETDALILDESDEFRNDDAIRTGFLVELVQELQKHYNSEQLHISPDGTVIPMPILALTATPISKDLDDLDVTMALLFPDRFGLPAKLVKNGVTKETFSQACLRDPKIAHLLLYGEKEKRIIRWTQEDLFGDLTYRLPPQEVVILDISPADLVIYDLVAEKATTTVEKKRRLADALFNREIIKVKFREKGWTPEAKSIEELKLHFLEIYNSAWKVYQKNMGITAEPFSEDWIAKYGDTEFVTQCFFHPELPKGMESLAEAVAYEPEYLELIEHWQSREVVSDKFAKLREMLEENIIRLPDGTYQFNKQIFITVPYHQVGITKSLHGKEPVTNSMPDFTLSLYELIHRWFPGLAFGKTACIDSDTSFNKRSDIAEKWRNRDIQLVVATMGTVYESMNWSVPTWVLDTEEGFGGILFVELDGPWSADEETQMRGRFGRPGDLVPYEEKLFVAKDTIDPAMIEHRRRKYLIAQVALAGIRLSKEDQELLSSGRETVVIYPDEGDFFIRRVVNTMQGVGEKAFYRELTKGEDGNNGFKKWAEAYYANQSDRQRFVAGNNAKWVVQAGLADVLGAIENPHILSVGSGSCLVNRLILETGTHVDMVNLDMNGYLLDLVKSDFPELGETVIGTASRFLDIVRDDNLPVIGEASCDAVECSLMIDLTGGEDRKSIFENICRATKPGGTVLFTLPISAMESVIESNGSSSLDTITVFKNLKYALETYFGLTIIEEKSGKIYGIDYKPFRQIAYAITCKKTGEVYTEHMNESLLNLASDATVGISKPGSRKKTRKLVIKKREYPFEYNDFKVFNPLSGLETVYVQTPLPAAVTQSERIDELPAPEHVVYASEANATQEKLRVRTQDEIYESIHKKIGKRSNQWIAYRALIRDIARENNMNYGEAENVFYAIFIKHPELPLPDQWPDITDSQSRFFRTIHGTIAQYFNQLRRR